MAASNGSSTSIKTIDRLVRILNCFSPEQPAWTLTKLSTHLDLPKGTLHRFLASMESHGILRRDDGDKQWRLGYRLFIWGDLAEESTALRRVAHPILRDLVAATGEMALLTVYQDQEIVCIGKVDTNHAIRLTLDVGTRRPPHAGASSKVLMAYLSEEETRAIIRERGLPKLCVNTITDPAELLAALDEIRERGYAVSHEETDPGAWGVATPVSDWRGSVIAAVGVAGPSLRFSEELVQKYVVLCQQAARRISSSLSGESGEPSRN